MQKQQKRTAGESISAGAKSALALARGEQDHGCIVHIPAAIDVKAFRAKVAMSQSEFSRAFGVSKRIRSETGVPGGRVVDSTR